MLSISRVGRLLALALVVGSAGSARLLAQNLTGTDRERGLIMLRAARKDLEQHYYDTTFHGVNLATRWDSAETLIRAAQSYSQMFGIIAWSLLSLEDSHTLFFPPARVDRVEYGWELRIVGDSCFVVDVTPGSDAARQGLARGDRVLRVGPFTPARPGFWQIPYWFYGINPQDAVPFVVRSVDGSERQLVVASKVIPGKRILDISGHSDDIWDIIRRAENEERQLDFELVQIGHKALIWRMPTFDADDHAIDRALGKANDFPALVLDLRGNGGGLERELLRMLGAFTDRSDTVGILHRRKEHVPLIVKPQGHFAGKLVVLVDSRSASASELFAQVVKMRHRGTVVGDRTWGAVMRSLTYSHQIGTDRVVFYNISVSDAEIVMADSTRLEGNGVVPDESVLPTPADLRDGRDPALARALALVGVELSPAGAGRLYADRR